MGSSHCHLTGSHWASRSSSFVATNTATQAFGVETPFASISFTPCPLTVQSRTARTFRALTDDVLVGISVPEVPMQSGRLAGRHGCAVVGAVVEAVAKDVDIRRLEAPFFRGPSW